VRGKPKVLITMGDPSGIGPEIVLKSLASHRVRRLAKFLVIGDYAVLKGVKNRLGIRLPLRIKETISEAEDNCINICDLGNVPKKGFKFGVLDKKYGLASLEYLTKALSIIKEDKSVALVTAPINKAAINKAGFCYGGHTEFLASKTKTLNYAMMLIGEPLRVTLITRHIPIKQIGKHLKQIDIISSIDLTHKFLTGYLGKRHPRIAVASLNPHAGEYGMLGDEEKKIIRPAVIKARKKRKNVFGPVAGDAIFYDAYKKKVDAVICMYHDQALIPLKMVARDKGVNITLGLPFIRTSPDHGTAFDIAGKAKADPSSMIEAIKTATKLVKTRC